MRKVMVFVLMLVLLPITQPQSVTFERAVIFRPDIIKNETDVDNLIYYSITHGITKIFMLVKEDTGENSGYVYFKSTLAPQAKNEDILKSVVEKAHANKIEIYAWVPLLYDAEAYKKGYGIEEKTNWVSPILGFDYEKRIVDEVSSYGVDGFLFSYVTFPDELSHSTVFINKFKEEYNLEDLNLIEEREKNSKTWQNWLEYRKKVLKNFFTKITSNLKNVGIVVSGEDSFLYDTVDYVVIFAGEDIYRVINSLELETTAKKYVVIDVESIREIRDILLDVEFADTVMYYLKSVEKKEFEKIKSSQDLFLNPYFVEVTVRTYLKREYDVDLWKEKNLDTVVIPMGNVRWTYFKWAGNYDNWSDYIKNTKIDYASDLSYVVRSRGLYVVYQIDAQSPEYVKQHRDVASITYEYTVVNDKVSITELDEKTDAYGYATEFKEMVSYVASNYTGDAILISNLSYYKDSFCDVCLESYMDYMELQGVKVLDWPKKDGVIDIEDSTIKSWKTNIITNFLRDLRKIVNKNNKELWVEARVSWNNLNDMSGIYGLYLPELEKVCDRIILIVDVEESPNILNLVKSLPSKKNYGILVVVGKGQTPVPLEILEALTKEVVDNSIDFIGFYPNYLVNDEMWDVVGKIGMYRFAVKDQRLMDLYSVGDYKNIFFEYTKIINEERIKEEQDRQTAKQFYHSARNEYKKVKDKVTEAEKLGINVFEFKTQIEEFEKLFDSAKADFIDGKYLDSQKKSKEILSDITVMNQKIEKKIEEERLKRIATGFLIVILFFVIVFLASRRMKR